MIKLMNLTVDKTTLSCIAIATGKALARGTVKSMPRGCLVSPARNGAISILSGVSTETLLKVELTGSICDFDTDRKVALAKANEHEVSSPFQQET